MAIFGIGRKKNTDTSADNSVPVDLQQYYNSGGSGIGKWILRVVAFLVVLALLVWAGIWLFNKLSNRDDAAVNNPQTATTQQQTEAQKKAAEDKAAADKKAAEDAKKAEDSKKAQEQANREAAQAQREASGASGSTPAPATPSQPQSTGTLPNSGPETTIAAGLFAAATAIGAALHTVVLRRRVSR